MLGAMQTKIYKRQNRFRTDDGQEGKQCQVRDAIRLLVEFHNGQIEFTVRLHGIAACVTYRALIKTSSYCIEPCSPPAITRPSRAISHATSASKRSARSRGPSNDRDV